MLASLLADCGVDPKAALERAETDANKAALKAECARAVETGIVGAPSPKAAIAAKSGNHALLAWLRSGAAATIQARGTGRFSRSKQVRINAETGRIIRGNRELSQSGPNPRLAHGSHARAAWLRPRMPYESILSAALWLPAASAVPNRRIYFSRLLLLKQSADIADDGLEGRRWADSGPYGAAPRRSAFPPERTSDSWVDLPSNTCSASELALQREPSSGPQIAPG